MENGGMENNGENSSPLTALPVDRLMATDWNVDRSWSKLSVYRMIRFGNKIKQD